MPDDNAEVTVIGPAGGRVCIEISVFPTVEVEVEPTQVIDVEAEVVSSGGGSDVESLVYEELPTSRELDVLRLIANGLTNKQVAERLNISFRTVESHRANLMAKWHTKDRAAFVQRGRELGLI